MPVLDTLQFLVVFLITIVGHLAIWCAVFNQVHATRLPRWLRKSAEKVIYLVVAAVMLALCLYALGMPVFGGKLLAGYSWVCACAFVLVATRWLLRRIAERPVNELESVQREKLDLGTGVEGQKYFGTQASLLGAIPFNQSLNLSIERRELRLSSWPEALDGMRIAHLTDWHFTGKVTQDFFRRVVECCNQLQPDYVFVTGDIVDTVDCLSWLPETLGALTSKHGKFYILGNHDLRVKDEPRLRAALSECGFQAVSGQWTSLQYKGAAFNLGGDELPWFTGAEHLPPPSGPSLLLAHTPDRIFHASKLGVDLVLAGHCHGGQIRIPLIGPIIAPSKHGVRFAGGTYKVNRCLMHVARGLSGDDPIRLNCLPELNLMTIRTGARSRH